MLELNPSGSRSFATKGSIFLKKMGNILNNPTTFADMQKMQNRDFEPAKTNITQFPNSTLPPIYDHTIGFPNGRKERGCNIYPDDTDYPHDGRADKYSYPHDGRADKDSYPHDGRADKDSYPHDRHNLYYLSSVTESINY